MPTSRACNARCVGCISLQPEDSGFPASQNRIDFRPTAGEIAEVMLLHAKRAKNPVLSFGQGCEGEPLTEAALIQEAVRQYRADNGPGTVNINTNASLPGVIEPLAKTGLSSIRVSLNSAIPEKYAAYHRPHGYSFKDVLESIRQAKQAGIGMPEVAIYEAPEVNAFATGMSRNNALVAVSTGLLRAMDRNEAEAAR